MPDHLPIPVTSVKGILALAVVGVYCIMWAFVVGHAVMNTTSTKDVLTDIGDFAGVIGTMTVIVVIVIQNFFRKTEAV